MKKAVESILAAKDALPVFKAGTRGHAAFIIKRLPRLGRARNYSYSVYYPKRAALLFLKPMNLI